jgi:hypothetical protein
MMTPVQSEEMVSEAIDRAGMVEKQFMDAQKLVGDFSEVGAKRLASAVEAMLPHFDMDSAAAKVSGELVADGALGEDLMRKLLYIVDAVNDAVDDSVLDAEMACDLDTIKTDQDLTYLAGKIRKAATDKQFRRWLEEEIEEQENESMEDQAPAAQPGGDDVDALFMARM